MKQAKYLMTFIVIIMVIVLFINYKNISSPVEELNYSDFLDKVKAGKVKEVTFVSDRALKGVYFTTDKKEKQFKVVIPPNAEKLPQQLVDNGVKTEVKEQSETSWLFFVFNLLPYVILFGFFVMLFRQAQNAGGSQAFSFGRSKAKQHTDSRGKVTFDDVAGVDEAKEELKEVVDFLRYPAKYKALGARIPKGVLLLGAPGTGKTLLGRAIAGEAGVPFYYISGSDFVEMFVGVGASRVRDLFETAKKTAPCIVFVDEIDAVGRQRGAGLGGGHDEREQTLNQLLVEMDGFENNNGVIVIAATNRPDVLDPALLRPGRFDRRVVVDKPDVKGRIAILKVHSRGKPLATDVELEILSKRTPGFSGADLENLLNEAALMAARNNKDKIDMGDCEEAIDRVVMGPERKSRIVSDKEKKITAFHEAGHALVAKLIPEADPVRKVTILPRGMAMGVTWTMPAEDKYTKSKKEIIAEIAVLMGGRVAEEIIFGEITTGASNDIKEATKLARGMITRYGMSDSLGPVAYGREQHNVFLGRDIVEDRNYSEDVAKTIDIEVRRVIESSYQKAKELLLQYQAKLDIIAETLLEQEVLEQDELEGIMKEEDTHRKVSKEGQNGKEEGEKSKKETLPKVPTFPPLKGPDLAFDN